VPLNRIVGFVKDRLATEQPASPEREHALQLATVAALLEIAYADQSLSMDEERHLVKLAEQMFGLSTDDTRGLIESADQIRTRSIDHWAVTDTVRRNCSLEERIEIVKTMWRMIYADGHLHDYEGYLVRKLADLLGLEHHVMIKAKLEVQKELGKTV
jgi:uncharacterized tellurite resistance protein B-like protein